MAREQQSTAQDKEDKARKKLLGSGYAAKAADAIKKRKATLAKIMKDI